MFEGDVIARHNGGIRETVTVRRLVQGEGVERIFPIHSPRISKIVVKKAGQVRRAKLYYLRDRVGKATKIRDDVKRQEKIDAGPEGGSRKLRRRPRRGRREGDRRKAGISKSAQKKKRQEASRKPPRKVGGRKRESEKQTHCLLIPVFCSFE